jgi:hypothetical protein
MKIVYMLSRKEIKGSEFAAMACGPRKEGEYQHPSPAKNNMVSRATVEMWLVDGMRVDVWNDDTRSWCRVVSG